MPHDVEPDPLIETVLADRYRIVQRVGVGSMGVVYEAEAIEAGTRVALKILRSSLGDLAAARFVREGKTMSLFRHRNIVDLLDAGRFDEDGLFLVTELVRGISLRELIEAGPVEPRRALAIARQVLEALGHAHAVGVVHRDIKPENVMLVDGGAPDRDAELVKVLDFGVAKLVGDTAALLEEGKLTKTGFATLGTPLYMAPELVLGRAVDGRCDLYAVGALLFELLTGRPPFDDPDPVVLMRHHVASAIPPLDELATPALALVVSEALAKQPEHRFSSTADMIDAIDRAAVSLEPEPALADEAAQVPALGHEVVPAPAPEAAPGAATASSSSSSPAPSSEPSPSSASSIEPRPAHPTWQALPPPPTGVRGPAPAARTGATTSPPVGAPPVFGPFTAASRDSLSHIATPRQWRRLAIGGAVFAAISIGAAALSRDGAGQGASFAKPAAARQSAPGAGAGAGGSVLARRGLELVASGEPATAVEYLEQGIASSRDDASAHLALGHARFALGRRLDGLAAYERAASLSKTAAADPQLVANALGVLDGRDAVSAVVALELLSTRVAPPQRDAIAAQASSGKLADVRHRAVAIAERDGFADRIDRIESWSLDLVQLSGCEDRKLAIARLRTTDRRAIPALRRARSLKCIEREATDAIGHLESH
ncbi:MAG: protein kinase domain-containing protein [Kofleriaceae bacterium]